ncbi:hypothetical protein OAG68_01700 [bacterium]|nr:hypothetical protein [bacterium]
MSSMILSVAFGFLPLVVIAQNGPAKDRQKLRQSTSDRELEELLRAIGTRDQGNFDIVALRGLLPSGVEPETRFMQVARDERVQKIYESLDSMPRWQAASLVSKSFNKNLDRFKTLAATGKSDDALNYGLHVDLWLSFEFESRKEFNRHFSDWNDWFVEGVVDRKHRDLGGPVPDEIQRHVFATSASPELLMYLNLVLIDEFRSNRVDDSSELALLLKEAGMYKPLSESYGMLEISPFSPDGDSDVEPLTEVPVFVDWSGLDVLKPEQRIQLMSKVQKIIDPQGVVEEALHELTESLLSLGGTVDLNDLESPAASKAKRAGTAIEFFGSLEDTRLSQGWYAEKPPTKKQLLAAVDRLYKETHIERRTEWRDIIGQLKEWLAEIPNEGIEIERRKTWQWPKDEETLDNLDEVERDEESEPKPHIRLVLSKTTALAGEMPKEEESDDPKNTEIENLRAAEGDLDD